MKLKGLSLCILGLIGGLILLPNFSNAVDQNFYPNLPATLQDGQNNDLELKSGVNFIFNDRYRVISVYGGGPYPRLKNVFWNNTGLYFIRSCAGGYDCTSINTSIELQGYIDGFYECAISDSPCSVGYKGISEFISNSEYSNPDYLHLVDNQWNNTTLYLCFVYESLNKQVCIAPDYAGLNNSLGFTYNPLPSQLGQSEDQISNFFTSSPFSSSSNPPAYLDDDYTNQDVMLSWSRLGYNLTLCYSNFPITDLFNMSGSVYQIYDDYLEDGMGAGTGATVIDLYNQVNLLSFESFMSQVVQNTRTMLNNNFIPNYFNGRPVGLGAIGSKIIDHLVYYSDVFNFTDYYQYCNFALNLSYDDPAWTGHYTGPTLPPDVENNLGTEKNIRICSQTGMESSAFCGGFSVGGGGGGGGSRVASISDFYNNGFAILHSLDGVSGPENGILPEYIVVAFIGFVLLYILKR